MASGGWPALPLALRPAGAHAEALRSPAAIDAELEAINERYRQILAARGDRPPAARARSADRPRAQPGGDAGRQLDRFSKTFIETAAVQDIVGSDVTVGKLLVGYSLRLQNGAPLNLAFGVGTTGDASDTDITFRMPFTFGN